MIKDVKKYSLDYKIDDFMIWCQQKDLRIKTITSYESCLRLFARYMKDEHNIDNINEIKEQHIREYIKYTKDRGKYTFVSDKNSLRINYPEDRKDYNSKIQENLKKQSQMLNLRDCFKILTQLNFMSIEITLLYNY